MNIKDIYAFLYKAFYYETFNYIIFRPKEVVIEELDNYFLQTTTLFNTRLFNGGFVDYPHTFYISEVSKQPSHLKGVIRNTKDNKTEIEIAVRAHESYPLSFVVNFILGLVCLYKLLSTGSAIFLWSMLWLIPIVLLFTVFYARKESRRMRKEFEEHLGIFPETEMSYR